jgi:hypothetical protein
MKFCLSQRQIKREIVFRVLQCVFRVFSYDPSIDQEINWVLGFSVCLLNGKTRGKWNVFHRVERGLIFFFNCKKFFLNQANWFSFYSLKNLTSMPTIFMSLNQVDGIWFKMCDLITVFFTSELANIGIWYLLNMNKKRSL